MISYSENLSATSPSSLGIKKNDANKAAKHKQLSLIFKGTVSLFSPSQNGDLLQQRGASQWLLGALLAQEDDGVGE